MPIEQLGPYRIERLLGRGGMGAVYAGVNEETGERAAVKALSETLADDPDFRERFVTEIETLKTLTHPNIVRLIGYGEQDGMLFYAMELVDGSTLQDALSKGRSFDWRETTAIGIQICAALKHAHDHGVVHRDLKPANLIYTLDLQVKLADFGIAKLFGATNITVAGGVIGTADYMSPEQAEGKLVTARSDLYSLGSVLYALLGGRPPFASNSIAAVIHGLRFESPEPIRRYVPEVPLELEEIVMQLLEKDPQKRIATARAVGNRLSAMRHALSLDTRVIDAPPDVDFPAGSSDAPSSRQTPSSTNDTQPPRSKARSPERTTGSDDVTSLLDKSDVGEFTVRPTSSSDASELLDADLGQYELAGPAVDTRQPSAPPSRKPISSGSATRSATGSATAANRFTKVTDRERRSSRVFSMEDDHGARWIAVLSAGGMGLLLVCAVIMAWWLMQPASADRIYVQIADAAAADDDEALSAMEGQIDDFLKRFKGDPRHDEIADLQRDMALQRIQRRLELRARRVGGADYLPPIEQAFLSALRVRRNSVELAQERLAHFVRVFSEQPSLTPEGKELVELAEHELKKLDAAPPDNSADHQKDLQELVDWANENLEGEDLRAFHLGIVALYDEKLWARDIVAKSRDALIPEMSEGIP